MSDEVIVVITLLFSAFFSASEIAFLSVNRLHVEILKNKGNYIGKLVSKFIHNPSYFIATMLVGNTIALVVYGVYMSKLLEPFLFEQITQNLPFAIADSSVNSLVMISQTIISTLLVLFTAEFIPKNVALVNPEKSLSIFAFFLNLIYILSYPMIWVIVNSSRFLIENVLGLDYEEDKPAFGLTDLDHYIQGTHISEDETTPDLDKVIFNNALELRTTKVRDCMVPRREICAVDVEDGIEKLAQEFIDSGHSKIPVYKDSIDNIIGYCHSLVLFKKPTVIEDVISDIVIVPETVLANELMIQFIAERKSMALVVDEFGGTSGIVTMEDVMEEIFGEIEDEHDASEDFFKRIAEKEYLVNARIEIDTLINDYQWAVPEGDYDTLGGYVISLVNDIPDEGQVIETELFKFVVEEIEGARIMYIRVFLKS